MTDNKKPGKATLDEWHSYPSNLKWGLFYYTKNDKRLFPPKRIKQFGWTVVERVSVREK